MISRWLYRIRFRRALRLIRGRVRDCWKDSGGDLGQFYSNFGFQIATVHHKRQIPLGVKRKLQNIFPKITPVQRAELLAAHREGQYKRFDPSI